MGKNIISQARGRGGPTYRVPTRKFQPRLVYRRDSGLVVDIIHDPARDTPLAKVVYPDKTEGYILAPEGIRVGDSTKDFIKPLEQTAEGTQIFGLETYPDSGPKICRSPGSFATVVTKTSSECVIRLPSKKTMKLSPLCMATVGIPAGEGMNEKPFLKAGNKFYKMHVRGKLYPRTKGNRMNIVDHPFGGSGHGHHRRPVSSDAPPGRKVGTVSPRRTGRRKR